MTDYSKDLRPASFRGIEFMTEGDDLSFGRRIQAHQYPGRDEPYHEDMGADLREFSINAVVLGAGFVSRSLALEKALEIAGPAQLVHPHYGQIQVIVIRSRRVQNSAAVGEVQFSITMQKYGGPQFPTAASNTAAGLLSTSEFSFDALTAEFNQFFTNSGIPDFLTSDAVARNQSFISNLTDVLSKAGMLRSLSTAIPVLDVLTSGFASQAIGLYTSLRDLAAPFKKPAIGNGISIIPANAVTLIKALSSASDLSLRDDSTATTSNKAIRIANAESLDLFHRGATLTASVGAIRNATFESQEEALLIRDQLGTRIFALRDRLGEANWNESWRATADLQAALNRDINSQIGRLPKTVRIRPQSPRSSLALANRLYGDDPQALVSKAEDINNRNGIRHPGYIPPSELEVLINVG